MKQIQGNSLDEMGKHDKVMLTAVGGQICADNGPKWAHPDEIDSEGHMDVSQGSEKLWEKRGNS